MIDMKNIKNFFYICLLSVAGLSAGCSSDHTEQPETDPQMTFEVIHPNQDTRATATQFETADRIGVYIAEAGEPLLHSGNYINNALLTYNGTAWTPAEPIYYNNGTYDVYAYYPYAVAPASVDDYPFEVALDQSIATAGSTPGGYEASDFLWATNKGVTAGTSPVSLTFAHRMSRIVVRLIKGEDYDGEIPEDAQVYIHSTVPTATIDLGAGVPTVDPYGKRHTIRARSESSTRHSAIVVPQRITNRLPLIEVVMKGVSYMMESTFVFKSGMQHNVSLVISKNPEQVKIEIGGEIEKWE